MRVNRKLVYAGLFLVTLGGVLVAADQGGVDTPTLADAARLWPLIFVAIGVAIVLRRTRLSLSSGMLAAAVPGLVLGGALAVAPRFAGDCGVRGDPATVASRDGRLLAGSDVSIKTGCGTLAIATHDGDAWSLSAGSTAGRMPFINATSESLSIGMTGKGWDTLEAGRDAWSVVLPTSEIGSLSVVANASRAQITLRGAAIGDIDLTANASEVDVDLSGGTVDQLSTVLNLGSMSLQLSDRADLSGSIRINAGAIEICSPPGLGLRITFRGTPRDVSVHGSDLDGGTYENVEYATATHRADLELRVNFGAVEINPIGGCK